MTKGERSGLRAPPKPATLCDILRELQALRDDIQRMLATQERRSPGHYHDATGIPGTEYRG